jgi:hypothetical protein
MSNFHKLHSGGKGYFYFADSGRRKQKFLTEPKGSDIGDLVGTITPEKLVGWGSMRYVFHSAVPDFIGYNSQFSTLEAAELHVAALIELRK